MSPSTLPTPRVHIRRKRGRPPARSEQRLVEGLMRFLGPERMEAIMRQTAVFEGPTEPSLEQAPASEEA